MKYINKTLLLILAISTLMSNIALASTKDTNNNVTVISPNGGEIWRIGSTYTIKWIEKGEALYQPSFIGLFKNGDYSPILREYGGEVIEQCSPVTATCLNFYNWTIGTEMMNFDITTGNYYKIEIDCFTCIEDRIDTSDNSFTISSAPLSAITVLSPNGGEVWKKGTIKVIKWTKTDNTGPKVKIELLKGGKSVRDISPNALNTGFYNWKIPSTQTIGNDYKIRIKSISNPAYTDMSDNNFAISSTLLSSITVVSPNGGEVWKRGTIKTIKWTKIGNTGTKVRIELLKGGKLVKVISPGAPNTGSYNWKIIANAGNDYKIRITSMSNPTYKDISDNNFKIS